MSERTLEMRLVSLGRRFGSYPSMWLRRRRKRRKRRKNVPRFFFEAPASLQYGGSEDRGLGSELRGEGGPTQRADTRSLSIFFLRCYFHAGISLAALSSPRRLNHGTWDLERPRESRGRERGRKKCKAAARARSVQSPHSTSSFIRVCFVCRRTKPLLCQLCVVRRLTKTLSLASAVVLDGGRSDFENGE